MPRIRLTMGRDGESVQTFQKGSGRAVFVRKDPREGGYVLMDAATGEPTNGNQYVQLPTVADMAAYLERNGYRKVEAEKL